MRAFTLFSALSALAAAASASTSPAPASIPAGANAVLPPSDVTLDKRTLCIGFLCLGGSTSASYDSDVNNCGRKNNQCKSDWLFGGGKQCVNGACAPQYCNNLFDFNWLTGNCQDVSSDTSNCGKCGQTCKASDIDNATGAKCVSGSCYPTSCSSGYTVSGNTCKLNVDTTSDVNNCGKVNNKCPSSYSNGSGSVCVNSQCQPKSCNNGYDWDASANKCRDVTSDLNNCGRCGQTCQFPFGSGSCKNGQCTLTSCLSGYTMSNGACTKVDTSSDPQNCGRVGNACSYDNGVAGCKSGTCYLDSCKSGYTLKTTNFFFWSSTTCEAIDTSSDEDNCGKVGNACPKSVLYGSAPTCSKGQCVSNCYSGYTWNPSSLTCQNTNTDLDNCGALNQKCTISNGVAKCSNGQCTAASCNDGYALKSGSCVGVDTQTDPKNCGLVGTVCPSSYRNGGVGICLAGKCQTLCDNLFDFDFLLGFCRDVSNDPTNCGKCGQKCTLTGASSTTCSKGQCLATACQSGYTLSNGACTKIDTTCDVNNCGAVGKACQFSPNGASGVCKNSQCVITSCPGGYTLNSGVCVKGGASQRARLAKKATVPEAKRLCPDQQIACPIAGSSSYAQAVEHHFNAATEFSGIMLGSGGFECLDTQQALDSCGGCASLGQGQDCTRIRGVNAVGCEAGQCVVFSCQQGWKPSLAGDKCIRVKASSHGRNSTSSSSAKRHLAGRHHHHGLVPHS
ncbi:hypothetical protein JCM10207_000310 [Rhodosporidiobolus poonsookiae]